MTDRLALYATFVRSVEAGSFTAVAEALKVSQPTVSRQIATLEDQLGTVLFQRSTRALTLTDDGRMFYGLAMAALDAADQAESAVGRRKGRATGRLRLACPGVFGRLHVIPRLPAFLERHPGIEIDLAMHDRFSDLVEDGIDLALRVGPVAESGLVGRKVGLSRRVVVALPDYLDRHGTPKHPSDLVHHRCIVYSGQSSGANWLFQSAEGPLTQAVGGPLRVDNTEAVRAAVLLGIGIAYIPVWHFVEREILDGRLTVLLPGYAPPSVPIMAVFPTRRHLPPKVRAAIDFFAEEFRSDPCLQG